MYVQLAAPLYGDEGMELARYGPCFVWVMHFVTQYNQDWTTSTFALESSAHLVAKITHFIFSLLTIH